MKIYWILAEQSGQIGICERPRGSDWLEDDLRSLKLQGIDGLVSLLTPPEISELDLQAEEQLCQNYALEWFAWPIPDRQVPQLSAAYLTWIDQLCQRIRAGQSMVAHCRMGVGRSSLIVACMLQQLNGQSPSAIWELIANKRGCAVPDTAEQYGWLERFSAYRKLSLEQGDE
jgi:protein-tyrosine phosphatase